MLVVLPVRALQSMTVDLEAWLVQGLIAQTEVFYSDQGGAERMAKSMQVPFLGRIPMDPCLSRSAAATSVPSSCFQLPSVLLRTVIVVSSANRPLTSQN